MAFDRRVKSYPVDPGISGWQAILAEPSPAVQLQGENTADFLIIGAGFAGLSAARRLTQMKPNARVVVLEAKRVGEGPAGRNSGFMIDLPHELSSSDYATNHENDLRHIKLNRQAIAFASEIAKDCKMPKEVFDPCGKVNGAAAAAAIQHNHDYAKHLESLGEPYEMLDPGRMKKLTGSDFYKSGIFTPGTVMIQPAAYVRGLANYLSDEVDIFENSPVKALRRENGNWSAKTGQGSVRAPKVIIAANGHVESFGFFKRKLMHIFLFASMTRALTDNEASASGEERWGVTPSDPMATTMRKVSGAGGTRIITRNRVVYAPSMHIGNDLVTRMGRDHDSSFLRRYPHLGSVTQEYRWAGRLCLSRNSVSAFGEVEPGVFSACCQNGLGTVRGTRLGMAAAEFATLGQTELVQAIQSEAQPQKLPPAPIDSIGAKAFMRYGEFKAREEM